MNQQTEQKTEQNEKPCLKELIAMGMGGMVGGGIFSVLGLSVTLSGHAAPIATPLAGILPSYAAGKAIASIKID